MAELHAGLLHLARRGLEASSVALRDAPDRGDSPDGQMPKFEISPAGSFLMVLTLLIFIIIIASVSFAGELLLTTETDWFRRSDTRFGVLSLP